MNSIAFIDLEINPSNKKILDIGAVKLDGSQFHQMSLDAFYHFFDGTQYVCGHNIFKHDINYLSKDLQTAPIIDTLYLSPLFFLHKQSHALLKDDKLLPDERNNPLNDAIKARDLFQEEITAFHEMDVALKIILSALLIDKKEFSAFFGYMNYETTNVEIE